MPAPKFRIGELAKSKRRWYAKKKKKKVAFSDLPAHEQRAELKRQENEHKDQLRREQEAVALALRAAEYSSRTPIAFGYGRVSHITQAVGESINSQHDRVLKFYEHMLKDQDVGWGGFVPEKGGVSAFKTPFLKRIGGRTLLAQLKPGDHIIVDKIDRLWRNVRDFTELAEWLKVSRITLHIVNMQGCQLSMNTPMGDFMLTLFVMLAQLESQTKSERLRMQFRHSESRGYWQRRGRPPGTKIVGEKPRQKLKWMWEERKLMAEIVRIWDEHHRIGKRRHKDKSRLPMYAEVQNWLRQPEQEDLLYRSKMLNPKHWTRDDTVEKYRMYELYLRTVEHPDEVPVAIICLRRENWKSARVPEYPADWYERQKRAEMKPNAEMLER